MLTFDIKQKEINTFELGQTDLFKKESHTYNHFQQLQKYYNSHEYWFEVPDRKLSEAGQILDSFFYDLKVADEPLDYCVVQDKEADSSDILRNSLANQR